jgi:hypothetical protein
MNGIRVNGALIRKEGRVRVGDEVHIGDVGYRLAAIDAPARRAAPTAPPPPAARQPIVSPDPKYLSLDIPVALPEDGRNFAVEETAPKMKTPAKKKGGRKPPSVIDLKASDMIDE